MASKRIFYKTDEEIELMRISSLLVCKTLAEVANTLKIGSTGKQLDRIAETFIRDNGAEPGFLGLYGFPATLCISVNEQVVHGIPGDVPYKEGDVVSIDCGVKLNDFYGDVAYTFTMSGISEETNLLCQVTKQCLDDAIAQAKPGNRIGDISNAVQQLAEKQHGFGVVRELVGHGLGREMHEAPEVPNFGRRGRGPQLQAGLVIAIEPMINLGTKSVVQLDDGWTIITKDKKVSAHYEHNVAVTKNGPDVLSDHTIIEKNIKNNSDLQQIVVKS